MFENWLKGSFKHFLNYNEIISDFDIEGKLFLSCDLDKL